MDDRGGLDRYVKGDFWRVDDRTGARIRASESRQEWTGAIVHRDDFEERHPLDFIRGRRDNQTVPDPRPVPEAVSVGPTQTALAAAATAGATSLEVDSTTGFVAGHTVAVMLDNMSRHLTTVSSVTDATHLVIAAALPWASSAGLAVIDYSATPAHDIG